MRGEHKIVISLVLCIHVCFAQNHLRSVNSNIFGFCTSNTFTYFSLSDTLFLNKVDNIEPKVLRFPGGSLGNFYHYGDPGYGLDINEISDWHSQRFAQRSISLVKAQEMRNHHHNYIEDFIHLAKHNNSQVILVANIFTSENDDILKMIRSIQAEGINVLGIELGSEVSNRAYKKHVPSVEEYIKLSRKYSDIIKSEYPDMPVGVVAAPFRRNMPKRIQDWNRRLSEEDFYDAVIHHSYAKVIDGDSDAGVMISEKNIDDPISERFELYKNRAIHFLQEDFLTDMRNYSEIFKNKDIWITEWNLQMTKTTGNTLLQSLFVSQYILEILSNPDLNNIKIATYHNLAGRDLSGSIFQTNNNSFKTHSTYKPFCFIAEIFKQDLMFSDRIYENKIFHYKFYDRSHNLKLSFVIDWNLNELTVTHHSEEKASKSMTLYSMNLYDTAQDNGDLQLDIKDSYE